MKNITEMISGVQSNPPLSESDSDLGVNQTVEAAKKKDELEKAAVIKIENAIAQHVERDNSPEAKMGRRKMAFRAMYGEFMCTLLFYTPIFASSVNSTLTGNTQTASLIVALVGGFMATGVSFGFSSVSGAHFNSSISFALWLTGKLSNRKVLGYIFVQLLASIIGMCIVAGCFHSMNGVSMQTAYEAVSVYPSDTNRLGKVFASEFFMTFFLTYIAFSVAFEDSESQKKSTMSLKTISDSKGLTLYASTPQSKTGFAPFSIGFMIFSLSLFGGSSGGAFNPGRLLGPALFSGKVKYLWLYWLGEFLGASCAGVLVGVMHSYGLSHRTKDDTVKTATESVKEALKTTQLSPLNGSSTSI
jgi:aquaporin NIP